MVHAPSLSGHADGRLVAIWGRDAEKRDSFARDFDVQSSESLEDLLDSVDAVSLAVAPSAQADIAQRALACGRHLLLEKPVSTDAVVVQRLADDIPSDVMATVFLTRLFDPVRAAWLCDSIGRGYDHADVEWVSSSLTPGSPYADSQWRKAPGGIIWDLMPHVLSQIVPVLGEIVDADMTDWPERNGKCGRLRHDGGATTDLRMTLKASPDQRAEWIRFSGPDGDSVSPAQALNFVQAHASAVHAVECRTQLEDDPLLRVTTVASAVTPTRIMSALAAAGHWALGKEQ